MIFPRPALCIIGRPLLVNDHNPNTLTSNTFLNSSSPTCSKKPPKATPALLTSPSKRPALNTCNYSLIALQEQSRPTELESQSFFAFLD